MPGTSSTPISARRVGPDRQRGHAPGDGADGPLGPATRPTVPTAMSLSLIMLRAGSADTIIARPLSCIHPSTPTSSHPDGTAPEALRADRVGARSLQADRPCHRRLRLARRAAEDRRRRARACDARTRTPRAAREFLGRLSDEDIRDALPTRSASCSCRARRTSASCRSKRRRAAVRSWRSARGGALETVVAGRDRRARRRACRPKRSPTPSRGVQRARSTPAPSARTPSASAAQRFGDEMEALVRRDLVRRRDAR